MFKVTERVATAMQMAVNFLANKYPDKSQEILTWIRMINPEVYGPDETMVQICFWKDSIKSDDIFFTFWFESYPNKNLHRLQVIICGETKYYKLDENKCLVLTTEKDL